MKLTIIFLFLFACSFSYAQYKMTDYVESSNIISFNLELEPANLPRLDYQKREIISYGFFDESKPGKLALPKKTFFIAIPSGSSIKYKVNVLKESSLDFVPAFNPTTFLINDSLVKYNYFPDEKKLYEIDEPILFDGFLWVSNVYCAQFTVNQCRYDYSNNKVKQIDVIRVEIQLDKNISGEIFFDGGSFDKNKFGCIVNKEYAEKFAVANPNILINDTTNDWIDYNKLYVKLRVGKDGIYRIDYNDLSSIGVNPSEVNPNTINIYKLGKKIPIYFFGGDDNSFDLNDYIEFIGERNMGGNYRETSETGEPYKNYLGTYTDSTTYWFTWNETEVVRANEVNNSNSISPIDTLLYHNYVEHYEKNVAFEFPTSNLIRREMPQWLENEFWVWYAMGVGVRNNDFKATSIYPNRPVKLLTKLLGSASQIVTNAHNLSLQLNNFPEVFDSGYIDKWEQKVLFVDTINSNLLTEGNNVLKINSYPTASNPNQVLVDWYEVEYPRYLNLDSLKLIFNFNYLTDATEKVIKISNADSINYSVWKVGQSSEKYLDFLISGNQVIIKDTVSSNDKYYVFTESQIFTPRFVSVKQFKNLRNSNLTADYILLTDTTFTQKSLEYRQFIEQEYDINSITINIEDIYDEFGYGYFSPEPIRLFLQSTYTYWLPPLPQYLCIVGDANYDYYKNVYLNNPTVVPNYQDYVPSYGVPVSDNWFVTWDSTGAYIPMMNLGRIPAKSIQEFQHYFTKHQNYLIQPYDDWNKSYLFFSGGAGTDSSELAMLKQTNDYVIQNLVRPIPIGGNYFHFYKTIIPMTNFGPYTPEVIQNTISNGGIFISYIGHSGTQTWDNSIVSPTQLNNDRNRSPLITDFGCSTVRFSEPDVLSFGELFINDLNSEAIAYVGNSSLGFTSTSTTFPRYFYSKILKDSVYNISEALKLSKLELLNNYGNTGTYALFALTNHMMGDPIISLPIPPKTNLVIKASDINYQFENLSDKTDSIQIGFNYFNWGMVTDTSFKILIQDIYHNEIAFTDTITQNIPFYVDSLIVKIPVFGKAGQHTLKNELDTENLIDEIFENDNTAEINYLVYSSLIKPLSLYSYENGIDSILTVVNPSLKTNANNIHVDISDNETFINFSNFNFPLDTLSTKINLKDYFYNDGKWVRAKLQDEETFAFTKYFHTGTPYKFAILDSTSALNITYTNSIFKNDVIQLDTNKIIFGAISAGFSDGKTAVITKNGENFVPISNRGQHICVFDANTYEFLEYRKFDLYSGGQPAYDAYYWFLDGLDSDKIIICAICDEASVNIDSVRAKVKEFGSIYIDSLGFRSSWAFIGRKGTPQGSMPEAYSMEYEGKAEIDTLITSFGEGNFTTPVIGPSNNWLSLKITEDNFSNSITKHRPIGIKHDGTSDTLNYLTLLNGLADLSDINSEQYPEIKILSELKASDDGQSPKVKSLSVNYKHPAELGINYQTVSINADTILAGGFIKLRYSVYNVGESDAENFYVKVQLVNYDNSRSELSNQKVVLLGVNENKSFEDSCQMQPGDSLKQVYISVDDSNSVSEIYEDNNFYSQPFFVKSDQLSPTINITFDNINIVDGDFISSTPEIRIQLNDESPLPIDDTTAISLWLNDHRIYYTPNDGILSYSFNQNNPKFVVDYKPILTDGDYTLVVVAKDESGNYVDSVSSLVRFTVSSQTKLMQVYNYPNPFANETYFTFRLSQIPEEIKIRIYTIAGRMIKEIVRKSSELNYDLNKIYWDGKDEDGDVIANGTYLYKMLMKSDDKVESVTQKLVIVK